MDGCREHRRSDNNFQGLVLPFSVDGQCGSRIELSLSGKVPLLTETKLTSPLYLHTTQSPGISSAWVRPDTSRLSVRKSAMCSQHRQASPSEARCPFHPSLPLSQSARLLLGGNKVCCKSNCAWVCEGWRSPAVFNPSQRRNSMALARNI